MAEPNPRRLNLQASTMADVQNKMVIRPKRRNMQLQENAHGNPKRQNPGPSAGTQDYGDKPNFRHSQGKVPYNVKEEIVALRQQLQDSKNQQNQLKMELVADNKRVLLYQSRFDRLKIHCNNCETNAATTIADLTKQPEEARGNKPQDNSDTAQDKSPVTDKLEDLIQNMQEQSSNPAAELCVEPSTQSMEVSHTDTSAKEADLEVLCRKQQQQIEQVQQQLLETQGQLEELQESLQESVQEHQDKEQSKEKQEDLLPQTSVSLQESVPETENTKQDKEEKEDLLLQNIKSLQESLQTNQEKENILITMMDKLEGQTKIEPEKKSKKKKLHWLSRLFS